MDDRHDFAHAALAELVGSRLCHDLVNPLSAISNGMELLSLSGTAPTPELELISAALGDAMGRIRFFRVAFGAARGDETLSEREVRDILSTVYGTGRLTVDWAETGDILRSEIKLAFLMLNCAETALPLGGTLQISSSPTGWRISGSGRKLVRDEELWGLFHPQGVLPVAPPAARVQFALLSQMVRDRGARVAARFDETENAISLSVIDA